MYLDKLHSHFGSDPEKMRPGALCGYCASVLFLGVFSSWCFIGGTISVDSRKHLCKYLFYGEFTRCANTRVPLLPRARFLRPAPVRGPPCLLRRRSFLG